LLLAARGKKSRGGNGHNRQSQTGHAGNGFGRARQITVHGALLSGLHARLRLFFANSICPEISASSKIGGNAQFPSAGRRGTLRREQRLAGPELKVRARDH
jgi:hypothetical protein